MEWISKISDNVLVRDLTIIGTNNSYSYINKNLLSFMYRTQDHTLQEQFSMGVRYIDITIKSVLGKCYISIGKSLYNLDDVFNMCIDFIDKYKDEFIILNLHIHNNSNIPFLKYINKNKSLAHRYVISNNPMMRVGDIRGKILLTNFINSNDYIENIRCRVNYNPKYDSSELNNLLKYHEIVNFDLESLNSEEHLYLNYAHTKGYIFKYIPYPKKSAKSINKMLLDGYKILRMERSVIVVDFVTKELCDVILTNNEKYYNNC